MKILKVAGILALVSAMWASAAQAYSRVEVAFVLDSTGSMGDLIDGAKAKIWSIANTIVDSNPNADIALALISYRDEGDEYVVQSAPLSEDVQALYGKLSKVSADGGGDTPEAVNAALDKAISGLQWTAGEDVKRIVFLVGDAPPHMDYQEKQYPAILKAAKAKHIVVNAVQAGDMAETTPIWQEIAQYGGGRFIAIPQNGGTVVIIETPFDSDILQLQRSLDKTIVPYGSEEQRAGLGAKMEQKAAAAPSVALDNSSYYAKRAKTKEVVTGGGDLLGDVKNNRVVVESIADKDLPTEMQAMSKAERKTYIEEKLAARGKLEVKIESLVAKRDAYMIAARKKAPKGKTDSFDAMVEETLKAQLK